MKNPKYILITYSGLLKQMLLFFAFIFYFLFFTFYLKSQWLQQTIPVSKPITGIEFVDTLHGWACTSHGSDSAYILYTANSGTNWLVQLSAYNMDFTDIEMLNSLTGYVSGDDYNIGLYKLFKTTNGGSNWTFITMVPNMYIGDMQFLNKDSAWESGVSIGPDVRTTTDGGNTWIVRTNELNGETGRIFFLNYNTGFVSAYPGLCKTTNAGLNWLSNGSFTQTVHSIFFINEITGWVGLGLNRLYKTTNGGLNWFMQTLPPNSNATVYDLYFFNSITGYAGTANNRINKTTDGGLNWGYQFDSGSSYRFSFINDLTGWSGATQYNGGISHTTNGGGPISGIVSIANEIPKLFKLYQNYPNPFNPITNIRFDINKNSYVKLIIFDILGREVELLVNQKLAVGSYKIDWNADNYSNGVYFYKLIIEGNIIETKKMILLK